MVKSMVTFIKSLIKRNKGFAKVAKVKQNEEEENCQEIDTIKNNKVEEPIVKEDYVPISIEDFDPDKKDILRTNIGYKTFFHAHPCPTNKKKVKLEYQAVSGKAMSVYLIFTWQGMQCTYVHIRYGHGKEKFLGAIDLFNGTLWSTPNSASEKSPLHHLAKQFIKLHMVGHAGKFFKVTFL